MPQTTHVLSRRALNRALLARQLLLTRHGKTAEATLEHLVGMQAQAPNLPYVGLWARLENFRHEDLSELVATRQAVRLSLMRNTIHLVTKRDALGLKPLFTPLGERGFMRGSPWGKGMEDMDLAKLHEAGNEIMRERPRTVAELAKRMAERFPGRDPLALAYGVRYMVPLVFTTPRGIWGAGGPVALTTFEAWLGQPPGPSYESKDVVRRYLAAFGPASPADFRAWSGLAMRGAFEELRSELTVFKSEAGGELFDVPKAPRPSPELGVSPRFLPDYDNILLGHADRTRIMERGRQLGLFSTNGIMKGSLLLDGFVRASWIPIKVKGTAATTLSITPFKNPIATSDQPPILDEAKRLLEFLAPGEKHDVRFEAVKA